MCGWVGVFGAPVEPHVLAAAGDTLASRGPDGSGERFIDGPLRCGLSHRRLAIIDPSEAGAQPMHDPERGVSVAYNGEIYNSPELRRELEARGVRFRSTCDTEVLLLGWAEWGDAVLDRIEGIFSFALVDERRGRVLLARDRLGVKPLYWALVDGALLAGSAPRALLALRPQLRDKFDRIALAQFLTLLWIPHPRTPWLGIHKLPPGEALAFDHGGLRRWRYWTPPAPGGESLEPQVLLSTLKSATDRQLLSDVPVGVLFSGGLDSTLLLRLMAEHYGDSGLHAVTAGYDADSQRLEIVPDDTMYARQVVRGDPRIALVEVEIDGEAERDVDELSFHFDDPVADPAAITLARLCRRSDTKVLLSGVGGEELFAGYPRHVALQLARRGAHLPVALRHRLGAASPLLWGGRPGPLYGARRNVQKLARSIGDEASPHYWRLMSQLTFDELERLVPGSAVEVFDELDGQTAPLDRATLADAVRFDRAQFLPNLNLAYVDKASMATGVEVRVPLLDESVVDAAFAADADTFIDDGVTKVPLRRASTGLVPRAVIDRPKSGFGGPARRWFQGPAGPRLRERIEVLGRDGIVNTAEALHIQEAAATGRQDAALAAWALVCLQAWYDEHGRTRERVA